MRVSWLSQRNFPQRLSMTLFLLLTIWLVLALTGFFVAPAVLASLVLAVAVWLPFAGRFHGIPLLTVLVVVPCMLLGFALLRGFFTGDGYGYWLPWGYEIAASGWMPQWLPLLHMPYASAGPFWALWLAAAFTFMPVSEFSVAVLPALFFSLGILVMLYWLRERGYGTWYLLAAMALAVFNPQSAFWSWNMLSESLLFLEVTLFFYFFDRVWNGNARSDRYALVLTFVLCLLTKFSALLLVVPLGILLIKRRGSLKLRPILVGISIAPLILWLGRNYLLYGNPVFPMLNELFGGPYARIHALSDPFAEWAVQYPTYQSRARLILQQVLLNYPLLLLSLVGFIKDKARSAYAALLVILILADIYFIFSASSGMRYLWPYLGLFIVFAMQGLKHLEQRGIRALIWAAAAWSVLRVPVTFSESAFIRTIEDWFLWFGQAVALVSEYIGQWPLIVFAALCAVGWLLARRAALWRFGTLLVLATLLLQVRWIANKSFLNTWSCIVMLAVLLLVLMMRQRWSPHVLKTLAVVYLVALFLTNSYAQAVVYLVRQGTEWPQKHVYAQSAALLPLIAGINGEEDTVLTIGGSEYFTWYMRKRAITLNSFAYLRDVGRPFSLELTPAEVQHDLRSAGVTLVLMNTESYTNNLADEFVAVLNADSVRFPKKCVPNTVLCVWEVTE